MNSYVLPVIWAESKFAKGNRYLILTDGILYKIKMNMNKNKNEIFVIKENPQDDIYTYIDRPHYVSYTMWSLNRYFHHVVISLIKVWVKSIK